MENYQEIINTSILGLRKAYELHEGLGKEGLESVQRNEFGETSLKIDIGCEKAIIDTFREANIPIRIISEEHGQVDLVDKPKYLGVLDGLDGTAVYKTSRGVGRYATMLGVFSNIDPNYGDYVFSGTMEHSLDRLLYAWKDSGTILSENGEEVKVRTSSKIELNNGTRVHADRLFDKVFETSIIEDTFLSKLGEHNYLLEDSSAVHYIDLAQGDADLVLECTRKGNLEIAVAFGLVNEAGGVIVSSDGYSIEDKKYLSFEQEEHVPIISASTLELARSLIEKIS